MFEGVAQHIHRFGSVDSGLYVEQPTFFGFAPGLGIANTAGRPVGRLVSRRRTFLEPLLEVVEPDHVDAYAQIEPDLPQGVAQVGKGVIGIAGRVANDDHPAAPPHHFIKPEIPKCPPSER